MSQAIFFHAGCPVCANAEDRLLDALDRGRYDVEIVHLGDRKDRLPEARDLGVQSVPALVLDGQVFHVNFGADLADLA